MAPETAALLSQLEAVKADGRALAGGLSPGQFNWRPGPGRWSIGDCLHHLNDAVSVTLPAFDRAVEDARRRGLVAPGPFRYGWLARLTVASMEPPPKFRMKSPAVFRTEHAERAPGEVLPRFAAVRDALAARVRAADGVDLGRARITSPASRWFRMPLGAYFQFLLAHERRHLWQARQVRAAPRFPAA